MRPGLGVQMTAIPNQCRSDVSIHHELVYEAVRASEKGTDLARKLRDSLSRLSLERGDGASKGDGRETPGARPSPVEDGHEALELDELGTMRVRFVLDNLTCCEEEAI